MPMSRYLAFGRDEVPPENSLTEIAVECLRDLGISARILEDMTGGPRP
jgi:hypothetical protein